MAEGGFPVPDYVHYKTKAAQADETTPSDGREQVWLSAIELACTPRRPLERELLRQKTAETAARYGIEADLKHAVDFVRKIESRPVGIRSRDDFRKAAAWLDRYADQLAPDLRSALAGHLLEQSVKVGHIPSLTEKFRWDEWAGRDPYTTEIQKWAEANLHKLATGNVYTSEQFACLDAAEIRECLPDLLQTASLGMGVIPPQRLGKTASALPEHEARILDALLDSHGQRPVHSGCGAPVEINDAVLASI